MNIETNNLIRIAKKIVNSAPFSMSTKEKELIAELKQAIYEIEAPPFMSKGDWVREFSSGYDGFRCTKCAKWVLHGHTLICDCDNDKKG